jgi:predicted RNA-binding Zn ribbon-like protein
MKLVGGDPCLDFVNTVGGRRPPGAGSPSVVRADKLAGYLDVLAWGRHSGQLSEAAARGLAMQAERRPREAAALLLRARALREAIYRLLLRTLTSGRPDPADLETLNAELAVARAQERLAAGTGRFRWEWAPAGERLDSVLWPVSRAAATLLTSGDLSRLRQCAGDECGWLFLDQSRNRSRQWCTMEDCGNVSKVRRFRERRQRH